MARKISDVEGIYYTLIVVGIIWFFKNFWLAIVAVFAILIIVVIIKSVYESYTSHCQICNAELKRKVYYCKINDKKVRICPNCNREIEKRVSKKAVSRLLD
mgnify:FL=1